MTRRPLSLLLATIFLVSLSCNLPNNHDGENDPTLPPSPVPSLQPDNPNPVPTDTPVIVHVVTPVSNPRTGRLVYDVDSSGTASEKRAPYGDSYKINRLERPF